jgi:hypothetical protein
MERVKKSKKAEVVEPTKPTAKDEADKINSYVRNYWLNKSKLETMKKNLTIMIEKFTLDHPEDLAKLQCSWVNFSMIQDEDAIKTSWGFFFKNQDMPKQLKESIDYALASDMLEAKGCPTAAIKKRKEGYFKHQKGDWE